MNFCTPLMLFVLSTGYLAIVLSFSLVDNSGGANNVSDGYVNATTITVPHQGFIAKRQNKGALTLIMFAINGFVTYYNDDTRGQFTQDLVTALWNGNPHYNYVVCHVAHEYTFQGVQGVDWDRKEIEVQFSSPSPIRFDVIVGGAGTFLRKGDGGYINWAYIGNVASRKEVGGDSVVTFNAP